MPTLSPGVEPEQTTHAPLPLREAFCEVSIVITVGVGESDVG